MTEKILCVDDEPNILAAYQRALRKEFAIHTASSGADGLKLIASEGPFAVIVTDMRMPGMDGIEFLAHARAVAPESVRVMLTGNADQQTAIQAVNEGAIFRFLNKPCEPDQFARTLTDSVHHYRMARAERELLEHTLSGVVQMLTEILSLVSPAAFGRATRVRKLVRKIANDMKVERVWQIEVAALLSQIGCLTLPTELLHKAYSGADMTASELSLLQNHPKIGHDLLAHIPRLESVAEIVAYQEKRFDGHGPPNVEMFGQRIPIGARMLKLALDFDKLHERFHSDAEAVRRIEARSSWYDPDMIAALRRCVDLEGQYEIRQLTLGQMTFDMTLAEDIVSNKGVLLLRDGQAITQALLVRLQNFAAGGAIHDRYSVRVPVKTGHGSDKLAPAA